MNKGGLALATNFDYTINGHKVLAHNFKGHAFICVPENITKKEFSPLDRHAQLSEIRELFCDNNEEEWIKLCRRLGRIARAADKNAEDECVE